jgi:hypothetical protein
VVGGRLVTYTSVIGRGARCLGALAGRWLGWEDVAEVDAVGELEV